MFKTLYSSVFPSASSKSYASNVQFIFRQQIQPWHPSSTLVHEAGVAVLRLSPTKFWDFSEKLFNAQNDYFDVNVVYETRNDTYKRLAKLGATVGVKEEEMYDLLKVSAKPNENGELNTGNKVTDDFKQLIKVTYSSQWTVVVLWQTNASHRRRDSRAFMYRRRFFLTYVCSLVISSLSLT